MQSKFSHRQILHVPSVNCNVWVFHLGVRLQFSFNSSFLKIIFVSWNVSACKSASTWSNSTSAFSVPTAATISSWKAINSLTTSCPLKKSFQHDFFWQFFGTRLYHVDSVLSTSYCQFRRSALLVLTLVNDDFPINATYLYPNDRSVKWNIWDRKCNDDPNIAAIGADAFSS